MKIAGSKNQGAWFRTNQFLATCSDTARGNLRLLIAESDFIDAAFTALQSIAATAGCTALALPADAATWAENLANDGIPWQIWNGRLTFTVYTKVGDTYIPTGQSEMLQFAKDLRRICRHFIFANKNLTDVFRIGLGQLGTAGHTGKSSGI